MQRLWSTGSGALSWQVLHEFYQNATRKMSLPPEAARFLVDTLIEWRPVDSSAALVHRAWHWVDTAQVPYWDSLILAAAELAGASVLLSEDFQEGRRFGELVVVNPFTSAPGS